MDSQNIGKMTILSQAIYRSNMTIKSPSHFSVREKLLKFIWNNKRPQIDKNNPEQKEQCISEPHVTPDI